MAKVITAIETFDFTDFNYSDWKLFLAGGITNVADWQSIIINKLKDVNNLILFNPRRKNFPINDPNASKEQIIWEYKYLKESDFILFWFGKGSLNPIVLYELGLHGNSVKKKKIFIGIDPEYERKQDVEIQTQLARPEIKIVYSLENLADQIRKYISNLSILINK